MANSFQETRCVMNLILVLLLGMVAVPCNSLVLSFIVPPNSLPVTFTPSNHEAADSSVPSSFVQSLDSILGSAEKFVQDLDVSEKGRVAREHKPHKKQAAAADSSATTTTPAVQKAADGSAAENQVLTPTVSGLTGEQKQEIVNEEYSEKEFSWEDWFGLGKSDVSVKKRRRIMMIATCSFLIAAVYLTCRWSRPESRHVYWNDGEEQQSTLLPSLCNFLCQYNYSNSSIPVLFMRMHFPYSNSGVPLWFDFIFLSSAFVGSCFGILILGVCGDIIGRKKSLQFSLWLITVAALLSAVSLDSFFYTYWWIVVWRFILGVGIGGCVPLSAVLSNEDTQGLVARALMTGRAYFWSAPGQLAPYVLALGMMEIITAYGMSIDNLHAVFLMNNIVLGVGALPAIISLYILRNRSDGEAFESQKAKTLGRLMEIVQQNPKHCFTLVGTGGSWFLLNTIFYGTWMYVPMILYQLQPQLPLHDVEMQSSVVGLTAVPGILFAISLTRQLGLRLLNVFGFLLQAVTFIAMAVLHDSDKPMLKFGCLCFLVFALNSGPSVGTYVLPTLCYPSHIRSTFHAFSAYLGKLGAVVGAFAAEPIMRLYGMRTFFTMQACLCLCGAVLSVAFLRRDADYGQLDKVNMPLWVKRSRTRDGSLSPRHKGENSPRRGDLSPRMRGDHSPRLKCKVEEPSFGPKFGSCD